ncbi:MAG: hypothetical protein ABGX07_10335 [Pirellulaceae bacterium]
MAHLSEIPQLHKLTIRNHSPITDTALRHIGSLSALHCLELDNLGEAEDVKWTSLQALEPLKDTLRSLRLHGSRRVDRDFPTLAAFTQLQNLHMDGSDVDDATLATIGKLTGLKRLSLSGRGMTDDGLRHFKPLSDLEHLTLDLHGVRGPGLVHLYGLQNLRFLNIFIDQENQQHKEALRAALPDCTIR